MTQNVWNHKEFTLVTSGDEVIVNKGSGTDSATEKYLNFASDALVRALTIVPDNYNCLLISINGELADNACPLIAAKGLTRQADGLLSSWNKFKLRAITDGTNIKVTAFVIG